MSRRFLVMLLFALTMQGCGARLPQVQPVTGPEGPASSCVEPVAGVTWDRWMSTGDAILNAWCTTVGKPVLRSPIAPAGAHEISQLQILSWNVHVGGGRAEKFIPELIAKATTGQGGLVVLVQEAFRGGWDVPETYPEDIRVPGAIRPRRPALDVVALAQDLALHVAYVPSMRNGRATNLSQREDRGNAVLSTEPLSDVVAIELPFGKQRRVAIAATVTPRGSRAKPIRVVSLHFDTDDHRVMQAEALAEKLKAFVDTKAMPLVVGGDLNSRDGLTDGAVIAMSEQVRREDACGTGRTSRWFLRLDVFFAKRIDYMFSTLDDFGLARTCQTLRDAEGSDHVPILMTVTF